MPSTRSKGGNKARLPLPHICTSKQQAAGVGADCDLGTAVVLVPPESKERKKNQEQNFKDASGNVSDVDSECIILAKTTPENVKSRVAPPTAPRLPDTRPSKSPLSKFTPAQNSSLFTYGGRPRRQAAIVGAARISKANEESQVDSVDKERIARESENESEETVIGDRDTRRPELGTKLDIVQEAAVILVEEECDEDNIGSLDEVDDDNDEDYEIDKEDSDDDDEGIMDGDDGISECEEMGMINGSQSAGNGKGLVTNRREESKGRIGSTMVRGIGFKVAKGQKKTGMVRKLQSNKVSNRPTIRHNGNFNQEDEDSNQVLLHSMLPLESRLSDPNPSHKSGSQQGSHNVSLELGAEARSSEVPPTLLCSNNEGVTSVKRECGLIGALFSSNSQKHSGQPYSEDDEPLLSTSHKRLLLTQDVHQKAKKNRGTPKKPGFGNGTAGGGFGGPSETKFRRKEIGAMLTVITKDIKWKDVQKAVGNDKRTAGSYASHWKNVLIKNILERYQE